MKKYFVPLIMFIGLLVTGCNTTKLAKIEPQLDQNIQVCTDRNDCIGLVKKSISSNWRIPYTYKKGMWAKIEITLDKDYNVINIYPLVNRGDWRFADSVEAAIVKSSPFTVLDGLKWQNDESISKIVLIFNPNPEFKSQNPADEMYRQAFEYMKLKNFNEAINQFEMIYKEYPNTKYGLNSKYWLGELHYSNRNISQAINCFEIVIADKDSPKRVDSLYKLGKIMELNGDLKRAKQYYMKILTQYKGTVLARLTRKRMNELGMDVNL
ncbi:MAG: tetratricopeptide repeat protein [Candidatus Thiodiazotropha sp.]